MTTDSVADDVRRFVAPTDEEIASMWRTIKARGGDAARADFLPVETIICFGLGLNTPPSPSGLVNVRKSATETKRAAALFGRAPSSLQSKHSNLESRPGRDGGRFTDGEVGRIFALDLEAFADAYRRTIEIARLEGINDAALPDFLGAGPGELDAVIEAGDLRADQLLATLDAPSAQDPTAAPTSMAQRIVSVRLSQQRFARKVLERSNFLCVFCGLSSRKVGLPSARMLVAGHIKPWRDSNDEERSSPTNGLAACPTHDAAFEARLLTVDGSGRIEYAPDLRDATQADPAWAAAFSGMQRFVQLPTSAVSASEALLAWHRDGSRSPVEERLRARILANT